MKIERELWGNFAVGVLFAVVLWFLFTQCAHAGIRSNLLTRLNEYMDDANNIKMSSANKIIFLDAAGRELGRMGLYIKRDTVITAANTELYSLNSDFAGVIQAAYRKHNKDRSVLPVIDRDSAYKIFETSVSDLQYVFVEDNSRLGVMGLPIRADTIILTYYATPAALSGDSTEWDLPDYYEEAGVKLTAAFCLLKIGTASAQAQAAVLRQSALEEIEALKNPTTQTRQAGDTPR